MKKLIIALFALATFSQAKAQIDFQQSVGASVYFDVSYYANGWEGITYNPRITIADMDPISLTAGAKPAVGLYYDSYYGGYFGFATPLNVDVNFGLGSTSDNSDGFGGFVGAGLDINVLAGNWTTIGPMLDGGIRFWFREVEYELNLGYTIDLTEEKSKLFTLGVSYYWD